MKLKLDFDAKKVIITKEAGDPRFKAGWSDAESGLLYQVRKILNSKEFGFDTIKKRAWKDGALVDETLQWVRTRKVNTPDSFAVWNGSYVLWDAGLEFNKLPVGGTLKLDLMRLD